jgi:carboxylesterase type B
LGYGSYVHTFHGVSFWNPTLDKDFVKDYTYNEFQNNHFVKVPTIIGDTTNEGLGFTGKTVSSKRRNNSLVSHLDPAGRGPAKVHPA